MLLTLLKLLVCLCPVMLEGLNFLVALCNFVCTFLCKFSYFDMRFEPSID